MHNYFKVIRGHIAPKVGHHPPKFSTLDESLHFFDDDDASDTRAALSEARAAFGLAGTVSVWRRAPTVPSSVPEVGEIVAVAEEAA